MRLVDRLILKEIVGPWLFGVGMFTSLLMAGTFLGRLTEWVVEGISMATIGQMFLLLMPAILVKTFSMSVLLAALLSFGRLSSDSEIVSLRAAGASIFRIVRPVALFSALVAIVTFAFNETVVPGATRRTVELTNQILHSGSVHSDMPVSKTIVQHKKLRLGIIAQNVNAMTQALEGVTVVNYDPQGHVTLFMMARELDFKGLNEWRVRGGATLLTPDGKELTKIAGDIWPEQVATIGQSFTDLIKERDDDFDAQSMNELAANIRKHQALQDKTEAEIANYQYGYWNKISVPLAAIVFGTLGAVLGIRNQRTGTAAGFALAVAIIFGYVTLANFMNVWAQGGVLPAWVASFAPIVIGLIASGIVMWRRNA